jgi:flagellar motor switch protein FliN/FliY
MQPNRLNADPPETGEQPLFSRGPLGRATERDGEKLGGARNLETILRIPITLQVVLGSATMPVANLMKLGRGAIVPLDHRIGEPVDIVVNGRVIARGEVVMVDDDNARFGVSLTEIAAPSGNVLGE